jgi:hypothetical protein
VPFILANQRRNTAPLISQPLRECDKCCFLLQNVATTCSLFDIMDNIIIAGISFVLAGQLLLFKHIYPR